MILVDSSVWIDIARGLSTEAVRYLRAREEVDDVATAGVICQEVLQGARSERDYKTLQGWLAAMHFLEPSGLSTYELAAHLFRKARAAGFTVRKPNDCLIAALALEHGAILLHNDRDFLALAQAEPALLLYPGRPH